MRNAQFSTIIFIIYLISFTYQYECTENSELSDLQMEVASINTKLNILLGKERSQKNTNGNNQIQNEPNLNPQIYPAKTCERITMDRQNFYLIFNSRRVQITYDNPANIFKNQNGYVLVERYEELVLIGDLNGARLVRACESGCNEVYLHWRQKAFRTLIADNKSFHACNFDYSKIIVDESVLKAIDVGMIQVD